MPPEKYNTHRLVGSNTKRAPDSHPRTVATVAALLQGAAPAGLLSKVGPLPRMANIGEVMAGLKAALDTSADDKERAHISDMIEAIRPIAVISARRALTPEEQAVVDGVAQQLLGEAEREVATQAGENREHQAARAAEFAEIEEATKAKGAATGVASDARRAVAGMVAAADEIGREIGEIMAAKEKKAQAAASRAANIDSRAAAARDAFDRLAAEAEHQREGAAAIDEESARADSRAADLRAEADRLAEAARRRAAEAETERKLGWDDAAARAAAEEAGQLAAESARRAHEAAEESGRVGQLVKQARKAVRKAISLSKGATAAQKKGEDLERARASLDRRLRAEETEADRRARRAGEAQVDLLQMAATADEEARKLEEHAEDVPEPGKPQLPEKPQHTRRRTRAAAAREAEEERAVGIIRRGVRGAPQGAPEQAEAETGEERKEPAGAAAFAAAEVPEIPGDIDLRGVSKTGIMDLLKALNIGGFTRVRSGGIEEGLRLLQAAEAEGGRGAPKPGTLAKVLENVRTGSALGIGLKFPRPQAPQ